MYSFLTGIQNQILREWIVPLMILGLVIAIVTASLKKDEVPAILVESIKVFVLLGAGFLLFCGALFILGDPHAPFK